MTKTLLVDGDNLTRIGFNGVKSMFNDIDHVGGIYHFINTIKKFLEENNYDKVVVFWDSDTNSSARKQIYPQYKSNRKHYVEDYKQDSLERQRNRIKQYLEEVFIRQVEVDGNEADDLIAEYCRIAEDENIVIFSADKDLTQLISERVSVYSPIKKIYYRFGDKIIFGDVGIPHYNVLTTKILVGDTSDNISGIEGLGEKKLVKFFPEILNNEIHVDDIRKKASILLEEKKSKVLENILTGKSKSGILGETFYEINNKLVNLKNPILSNGASEMVLEIYRDVIDPTDRGYKNLMRMMIEDGMFKFLPKNDEDWVKFLTPFLKLIRKEKRKI